MQIFVSDSTSPSQNLATISTATHHIISLPPTLATMDKIIDASFDRVEKALTTLVNSIANYTANPQAAVELVKADSELIDGLKLRMSASHPIPNPHKFWQHILTTSSTHPPNQPRPPPRPPLPTHNSRHPNQRHPYHPQHHPRRNFSHSCAESR